MSTRSDFYSVDETVTEGDPTNEEMLSDEERMLEKVQELRLLVEPLYSDWTITKKAWALFDGLEAYFEQQIEQQKQPPMDQDEEWPDPFAETS